MPNIIIEIDGQEVLDKTVNIDCGCSADYYMDDILENIPELPDRKKRQVLGQLGIDPYTVKEAMPEMSRVLRKQDRLDLAVRLEEIVDLLS